MTRLALVATLALAGCVQQHDVDQCLRERLFNDCLARIPPGPAQTHYSGLEHVVSECASNAYNMSVRPTDQIAKECQR